MSEQAALLLVDDLEENLLALEAALAPLGHRMVRARSGEEALRHLLRDDEVATVVLDVQMPGMDGFETALAIQARDRTRHIPIVFLTAIDRDDAHRLRGFAAGGADYIAKPVDPDVLQAKVAVFVRLHMTERRLRAREAELRRQAAELARSNADLDHFAAVVSHDLAEPLHVVTGFAELLADHLADRDPTATRWLADMRSCAARMSRLLEELLTLSRLGAGTDSPATALGDAAGDAVADLAHLLARTGSTVEVAPDLPAVAANRRQVSQMLQNLIGNAVGHSPGRAVHVVVSAAERDGWVTVRVSDDGVGLTAAECERLRCLLEGRSDDAGPVTGVGLPMVGRSVRRLGGTVTLERGDPAGLTVTFSLPSAERGRGQ